MGQLCTSRGDFHDFASLPYEVGTIHYLILQTRDTETFNSLLPTALWENFSVKDPQLSRDPQMDGQAWRPGLKGLSLPLREGAI